jgi:hypothetical protein
VKGHGPHMCFASRRFVKDPKTIAGFAFSKTCQVVFTRLVHSFLDAMLDPNTFEAYELGPPWVPPRWAAEVVARLGNGLDAAISKHCRTPRGTLHVGDVVKFGPEHRLGEVGLLVRTSGQGSLARFWAIVKPFQRIGADWLDQTVPPEIAELAVVSSGFCACRVGGRLVV